MTGSKDMISKKAKYTFQALNDAALDHRLCIAACFNRTSGKKTYVICETFTENGQTVFNPVAKLFDGNPFNEVTHPGVAAHKLI